MALLDPVAEDVALFANLFIFFSYLVMVGFLLYVGKQIHYEKKITLPWIILSAGLLFTSLNIFTEIIGTTTGVYIIPRPTLWYVFNVVGSIGLIVGFAAIITERQVELNRLKKRKLEIKDLMDSLKEQYYKREISEPDLRRLYTDLVEQLAQIEIKIKKLEKSKKKK